MLIAYTSQHLLLGTVLNTLNYDYFKVVIVHMFIFLEYVRSTKRTIVDPLMIRPPHIDFCIIKISKREFNILPI